MRKIKKVICLALVALTTVSSAAVSVNAGTGRKYINSTYGYLTGATNGGIYDGLNEKFFNSTAETAKAVPRIRTYLKVMYAKSGTTIGDASSGWLTNEKRATSWDFEMHHFRNKETGCYDGFVNTKCVAYGTADAITDKAYAVYTSVVK